MQQATLISRMKLVVSIAFISIVISRLMTKSTFDLVDNAVYRIAYVPVTEEQAVLR